MIKCDLCGQDIPTGQATITVKNGKNVYYTCPRDTHLLSTCQTCRSALRCDFFESPIDIPHTIQKQIQRGPMTQIIQIINPDRIAETCAKGCKCYDGENCNRSFGICGKYECILDEKP